MGSIAAAPLGDRDDICSDDRSRQLWKLLRGVICSARFLDLTEARPLAGSYWAVVLLVLSVS
jgi:hypothetical protein